MKYEKPQPGNPHQLTVNQHCFPRASIARFAGHDDRVDVRLMEHSKTIRAKPEDPVFCARRAWDQKAESGFMLEVESRYQDLAHEIASGRLRRRLEPDEQSVVTDMYGLWNIRWRYSSQPVPDQQLEGVVALAHEYSKDDREQLEKHGVTAVKPDFSIPGRHFTGVHAHRNLAAVREEMQHVQWGIVKSRQGQFVVGDNSSNAHLLPVTPDRCLIDQPGYRTIQPADLSRLNRLAVETSTRHYFARSFEECPGLDEAQEPS